MSRPMFRLLVALLVVGCASRALCADITGMVTDTTGNRVAGVKVIAMSDRTGDVVGESISGTKGEYYIPHIAPETYDIALDPAGKPFQPATAVASVPKQGLTVNWRVSQSAPASALAAPHAAAPLLWDTRDLDLGGLLVGGIAGVGAGALAGYATGGGSNTSNSFILLPAQTPSM
ncbi:MAG TPA: carboxypeptidase-like regulatory domain-containing protein [Candidatus Binataceae bacterium]|nr:carboxypeptidase-like regulatory domain-containing protein [Candidatus Binataceae bacterium]